MQCKIKILYRHLFKCPEELLLILLEKVQVESFSDFMAELL